MQPIPRVQTLTVASLRRRPRQAGAAARGAARVPLWGGGAAERADSADAGADLGPRTDARCVGAPTRGAVNERAETGSGPSGPAGKQRFRPKPLAFAVRRRNLSGGDARPAWRSTQQDGRARARNVQPPCRQGREVEVDALAGEDPGLAVQRQVIALLRDQHRHGRPGPGRPRSICRGGNGAWWKLSQLPQANAKHYIAQAWVHVRHHAPFGGPDPPAALFCYSRDLSSDHPVQHLRTFAGTLQADAYAG